MILDLDHDQAGGLDYLGQMWTWVSGEAESIANPAYEIDYLYGSDRTAKHLRGSDLTAWLLEGSDKGLKSL